MDRLAVAMFAVCCVAATQALPGFGSIRMNQIANGPESYRLQFSHYLTAFTQFKTEHGKTYGSADEEAQRFSVFVSNVKRIEEHNLKFHKGESTYFMGINKFSDMTHEEYQQYNRLGKYSKMGKMSFSRCFAYSPRGSTPESIDWREKGAVTPVKDQAACGSCWTFSSTGAIEGQNFLNTGKLLSFSEQQIVDCCQSQFCEGCNGGYMDTAFAYINSTGGLELESDYPYTGEDDQCHYQQSKSHVKVVGCADVATGNETALQNAIGNVGPLSVAVDANHPSFMSYAGGVFDEPDCKNHVEELDHGVLAVGYGSQDGQDFWIVKNSWADTWGIKGYILMSRNKNNQCGIATLASFPQTAQP